ncbi:tRNA (cytosine(38)-C(5))-methyltransferase-like [Sphaeramia orbicularis]|uniref:tRNA (cytosine(38)-C(5))-methyltransferase-like n=1 Tax=Sphaeramia orbicularis TaxID=375764 RepID=UPI0011809CAF|nr:tRNA (cytosine(38)-C(5))-methyltransferase-like [Sphaeramia orbicularis]
MILMSPPCQPFTRIGLKGDVVDLRTKSFLYILDLLPRFSRLPRYILLENVKGFEVSCAREHLVLTLKECGYSFQEVMVSPTSVGIPNSRLRYFLIAKISAESDGDEMQKKISDAFPVPAEPTDQDPHGPDVEPHPSPVLYKLETTTDAQRKKCQNSDLSIRQIQDFLEPSKEINMEDYLLPPKTLLRYALLLDIVRPTCRRSVCFTKGYGRYVEGTGSVLQSSTEVQMEDVFKDLDHLSDEDKLKELLKLKLRYFTPREVANLMGFPKTFSVPEQTSVKQQYRVLGNSLNVTVVSRLLQLLVL